MQAFQILKSALLGLAAGILATACLFVGFRWLAYFAITIFPPTIGLFFGLFRQSLAEAWRGALSGLLGVLVGTILFWLHGSVLLGTAIALTQAGVPARLLHSLTNPIAWSLAFVAATPAWMRGSNRAGALAAAMCFLGVNVIGFLAPSTTQLNDIRMRDAWITQHVAGFFTFAINGLILGLAVPISEVRVGDA